MADVQEITVGNQTFEFPASMSEDEIKRLINLELQNSNDSENNIMPTGLNTQINNVADQTQNMLSNVLREGNAERGSTGVPEPIITNNPNVNKSKLSQIANKLQNRDFYGGVASTTGAALATAFSPPGTRIYTIPTGYTLGEAAGEKIYDVVESLRGNQKPPENIKESLLKSGKDVVDSAKYNMLFSSIPGAGQFIKQKLAGEKARSLYESAKQLNIPLSIGEVSETGIAKGYIKVAGVFPWIGKSFQKQTANTKESLQKINKDILNTLAPNSTIANLGIDVVNAAKKSYKDFRQLSSALYTNFNNLSKNLKNPNIIGLNNTKNYINKIIQETPTFRLGGGKPTTIEGFVDPVAPFLKKISKITGNIAPNQYRELQRQINSMMNKGAKEGWDIKRLQNLKIQLEKDFSSLVMPKNISKTDIELFNKIKEAHSFANKFYSNGMKIFDSPTAKTFQKVDKNIFKSGFEKSGNLNADEIVSKVINLNSPQSLLNLKKLLGKDLYNKVSKNWLDDVWQKAVNKRSSIDESSTILNFDPNILAKELGLVGKNSKIRNDTIKLLFKNTGVNYNQIKNLIKISKNYENVNIPNVSSFVARRAMLGGLAAITSLVTGNGGKFILGILTGKYGTRLLSSPKKLDEAMNVLKFDSPKITNYLAIGKILDFIAGDPEVPSKEKQVLFEMKEEIIDKAKELNKNRFN